MLCENSNSYKGVPAIFVIAVVEIKACVQLNVYYLDQNNSKERQDTFVLVSFDRPLQEARKK